MSVLRSLDIPFLSFKSVPRWEWIAFAAIILVGLVFRVGFPEQSYYNLHVERDLYRATQLLRGDAFPLLGSEMQYGGRVFGPVIYFIYTLPLLFTSNPVGVMIYVGLVNTLVLAGCWAFTRYWFGVLPALFATALYAVFPLEIVQLRYMWNPCFLPALMLAMYAFLFRYSIKGSHWALCGTLLFFVLGFQIHFSVLMVLPVLIVGLVMAFRWPKARVLAGTILIIALLFLPYAISEYVSTQSNLAETLEAPVAVKEAAKRYAFNPVAWRNFVHVITFDWAEEAPRMGFTYLYYIRTELQASLGERFQYLSNFLIFIGGVQLTFWGIGLLSIILSIVSCLRMKSAPDPDRKRYHAQLAKAYILLLLWQLIPLPFLSFFNFHPMKGDAPSLIPLRYYLISFPAQFIIAGIGFSRVAMLSRAALRTVACVLLAVCISYAAVDAAYLRQMKISGIAIPYLYFRTPTLEVMLEIKERLLKDFKINMQDYYNDVTGQNILVPYCGETTLDFLITQDRRAWTNPGLPYGNHVIVYRPVYRDQPGVIMIADETRKLRLPRQADGSPAKIVKEETFRDITIYQVEGHLPREVRVFAPFEKTNVYYRDEKMKYLGWKPLPK
ncbi:hypothetical protein IT570_05195 [Candidatus Sumerlaeota bacterium]|nr:hypothetical protein [Candidatus Sumerlaeota bacterium]